MKKIMKFALLTAMLLLVLTSCYPGDGTNNILNQAGFFWGLFHGMTSFFTLVASFFSKNVTIYEVYNTGFLYNLGFLIGIGSPLFGFGFGSKRRR